MKKGIIDKSYNGKVIRTISKEYAREHLYYDEKSGRAFYDKASSNNQNTLSLTKRALGTDLRILEVSSGSVLVTYNLNSRYSFYILLSEWGIDKVYTPEENPEMYI